MRSRSVRRTLAGIVLVLALAGCSDPVYPSEVVDGLGEEMVGAGLTGTEEYSYSDPYGYDFPTPKGAQWGVFGTVAAADPAAGTLTVDVTRSVELDEDGYGETVDVVERNTYQVAEAIRRCDLHDPEGGYTLPLGELLQGATVTVFGTSERVLTVSADNLRYCDRPAGE